MPASPVILCIETSTKICSVAIVQEGKVLALKESCDESYSHAENLTVFIEKACKQSNILLKEIDAVAVGKGPGSFTGLRIGVSTAKGVCYALNKPLIGIHSLEAMAVGAIKNISHNCFTPSLFCTMIDARRMEVYCAVYNEQMNEIKKPSAEVIHKNSFSELLKDYKIFFIGDGAEKCRQKIKHPNAVFTEKIGLSAQFMMPLAEQKFKANEFETLAYFEPFYLKDFVGGGSTA